MNSIGIPERRRGSIIHFLMDIDQFIQDIINYSGKYNRNYVGRSCFVSINYVEANIISNNLETRITIIFYQNEVRKYKKN